MIDFSNINTISLNDSKRLRESFFHSPKKKNDRHRRKKRIILISTISVLIIAALFIFFTSNFNIVIFPQYDNRNTEKTPNLINKRNYASVNIINPQLDSKIFKNVLLIDVPFNTKSGLSITLKDKINLHNSQIILVIKKPDNKFNLFTILRDTSFFSNASNPIKLNVSIHSNNAYYIKIPIDVGDNIGKDVNIKRINQLRFMFYQKNVDSLPLLVKKVYIKRR